MNSFHTLSQRIKIAAVLATAGIILPRVSEAVTVKKAAAVNPVNSSNGSFANVTSFPDFIQRVSQIINLIIPLIISLTVLVFIWGVFKLVVAGDSEDARKEARATITFGVVSLFVMVSVWGLVNILKASFFGSGLIVPQLK